MDLREARRSPAGHGRARHPWEVTRFDFFQSLLRKTRRLSPSCEILDVGSGDAWFSGQLARHNSLPTITCWDHNYDEDSAVRLGVDTSALRLSKTRPDKRFDLILLLDVLEHVEDDVPFLRETVEQNLRPGGTLLISVPAWKQLLSAHDRWLQHFRRYVPSEFDAALAGAALRCIQKGGLFHSLLVPRSLGALKERLFTSDPLREEPTLDWQAGPIVSKLVTSALRADNLLSHAASRAGVTLPGLSLWALCEQQS